MCGRNCYSGHSNRATPKGAAISEETKSLLTSEPNEASTYFYARTDPTIRTDRDLTCEAARLGRIPFKQLGGSSETCWQMRPGA